MTVELTLLIAKITLLLAFGLVLDALLRRRAALTMSVLWNAILLVLVIFPMASWLAPRWNWQLLPVTELQSALPIHSLVPDVRDSSPDDPPQKMPAAEWRGTGGSDISSPPSQLVLGPTTLGWILAVAYALGVTLLIARLAAAWFGVRAIRRGAIPVPLGVWAETLKKEQASLNLVSRVRLVQSERVNVPCAVGIRDRVIVIPTWLASTSDRDLVSTVIVHELAHLARGDLAWQLLERLVEAFLWFHPLVWLASRRIAFIRERVCDEYVVHALGDAKAYALALVDMATHTCRKQSLVCGLAVVRSSNLDHRLRALLQSRGNPRLKVARPIGWSLTVASILIALGLACVEMTHASGNPLAQNDPALGEKGQPIAKKKGLIFAMATLKVKRAGEESEKDFRGIIAIDPDTGKWRKITGSGHSVRVSPDGETLAFIKFAGDDTSIWNCDTHGADNPGKIADFGNFPIWSRDGKYLVTNKGIIGQHETWQMEADGSKAKNLPIPKTDEVDDWSSDGKWFVTVSDRHPPHGHGYQLYVMHPDGTNERRLTKNGLNCYPRFSPDSRKIVYIHQTHKEGNSIRMVDIDGKNDREILREEGLVYPHFACWSPDGKRLAIIRPEWEGVDEKGNRFGSGKLGQHLEIMDADGQNRRVLELADAKIFWLGHADWKEIRMRD